MIARIQIEAERPSRHRAAQPGRVSATPTMGSSGWRRECTSTQGGVSHPAVGDLLPLQRRAAWGHSRPQEPRVVFASSEGGARVQTGPVSAPFQRAQHRPVVPKMRLAPLGSVRPKRAISSSRRSRSPAFGRSYRRLQYVIMKK